MEYIVTGSDGKEYGPASVDTLREWVASNRVSPESQLRNFQTGEVVAARSVPGLFGPIAAPQPVSPPQGNWSQPPVPGYAKPVSYDSGSGELWGAIIRSGLAIVFFFVFHGIGLIFAAYALYYAIQ